MTATAPRQALDSDGLISCANLRELPLQIVLRDRPEWRGHPIAIVAEDRPEAPLQIVNHEARRLHLLPGTRYGAARELVPALRATVLAEARVSAVVADLVTALQTFSPRVEADKRRAGVFYLDPSGLGRLYGSIEIWAKAVHGYLKGRSWHASVVVGFGRFPTYALAQIQTGVRVLSHEATRASLLKVPIMSLDLSPTLRDGLARLAVRTLGDLLRLSEAELASRFGAEAAEIHRLASDNPQLPIQPERFDEPLQVSFEVDPPDDDLIRLVFSIKSALHEVMGHMLSRAESLTAIVIELSLENRTKRTDRIETASPTRDAMLVVDLIRLRLSDLKLEDKVQEVKLHLETIRASLEQLLLFPTRPKRDLDAGNRALARVQAVFGHGSVTRASLREAHLPEARFVWEPIKTLSTARLELAPTGDPFPLVRRVFGKPRPLSAVLDSNRPTASIHLGSRGPVVRWFGPYRVSGGWWRRLVERDYYYAETHRGELLWLYHDRQRKRWFLQGMVD